MADEGVEHQSLVPAIHWPVAFYLSSALSVLVLEPLASPHNNVCPIRLKRAIQTLLSFGKTFDAKKNSNGLWTKYMTVPKR